MARKRYIPDDEDNLSTWAANLATKAAVPANSAGMGWSPAEESDVVSAANGIIAAVQAKEQARQAWMAENSEQDEVIASSIAVIRPLVARGKETPTATEAILTELGLLGAESDFNPETYVAELRSIEALGGGMVRVKFSKARGELTAARLQIRKAGVAGWTTVATMLRSPYTHQLALTTPGSPESFEARVRGVVGNDEIGQPSPALTVLVD